MSSHFKQTCACGSKLSPTWQYDARGGALCKTCPQCHDKSMAKFKNDALINPNCRTGNIRNAQQTPGPLPTHSAKLG